MDARRRPPPTPLLRPSSSSTTSLNNNKRSTSPIPKASDALPLPLYLTNGIFFTLFFSVAYYLLHRWRDKIRSSTPLHVVTLSELAAIVSLIASFIYLLGFFGIDFVQSFIISPRADSDVDAADVDNSSAADVAKRRNNLNSFSHLNCNRALTMDQSPPPPPPPMVMTSASDEEIVKSVISGTIPSYSLESKLNDCHRAAAIRREALQRTTGKSLVGLPLDGFDYESILGQCCEMPVGYVQLPVGIAGPLLLNGCEYSVPMATTEGCLVASTNRGCKAIYASGGATGILLKDGITRAPVVRFSTSERASQLKFFLEDPLNFDTLGVVFNKYVFLFFFQLLYMQVRADVSTFLG